MLASTSQKFLALCLLAAVVVAICPAVVSAQADAPPVTETKDPKGFLYVVPQTDKPQELVSFLVRLQQFEPASREEADEYQAKAPQASKAAAERILELVKDEKDEIHRMAQHVLISNEIQSMYRTDDAKQHSDAAEKVIKFVNSAEDFGQDQVSMIILEADVLESAATPEVAAKYLPKLAEIFDKTKHPQLMEQAELLRGTARRLQLLGHEMPFKGKTIDGKPFDLAALKGKVVLIDFWATWCGFCVEEMPHTEELYKAYKDRGFEVVGVSLDESREDLVAFLKEKKLPWITIYDDEHMGEHPAVKEYGIYGLPTVMLIGKDGKVITFDARGEQLDEHLKTLLGPRVPAQEPAPGK